MRLRTLTLLGALALLQSLGCRPSTRSDLQGSRTYKGTNVCGFVEDELGNMITMVPKISFVADKSFPEEFVPLITLSMNVWNEAVGETVFSYAGRVEDGGLGTEAQSERQSERQPEGHSLLQWSSEWREDEKQKPAEAQITVIDQKIVKAVINFNAKYFSFSTSAKEGTFDFKSVLVHELGHVLGLAHSQVSESVMGATLEKGSRRDTLNQSDYENLSCGLKKF